MANYNAVSRTNYFHVKDEEEFKDFMSHLSVDSGDPLCDFSKTDKDGNVIHGFGAHGSVIYSDEDNIDQDELFYRIQEHLPSDEIFVYKEIGHEKLAYVDGFVVIVTPMVINRISLDDWLREQGKKLNPKNLVDAG